MSDFYSYTFHTLAYKNAFIHIKMSGNKEYFAVQDLDFKLYNGFKSLHSAKIFITRKLKRGA